MSDCTQWNQIERASDCEVRHEARVAAAGHVRGCAPCRAKLRTHLQLRRAVRSMPMPAIDPAFSARCQAAVMMARNLALQTWLRRTTAIAAAVLAACTLVATLANGNSTASGDEIETYLVAHAGDSSTDTPQNVARWIVQDLKGR